jgi:hypothetical protein
MFTYYPNNCLSQWLAVSWALCINDPYKSLITQANKSLGFMKDGELTELLGG